MGLSASQQIAAALIALAELGVIGIFVGPTRLLNVAEAMRVLPVGALTSFSVADLPEWGGLLALARSRQDLYVTRWAFLVPGVSIAAAAVAFSTLGLGIARHYHRRNLPQDLRSRRAVVAALVVALLVAPAFALPPRHADGVQLGEAARQRAVVGGDLGSAFAEAHLSVTSVDRTDARLQQVGPAVLQVDGPSGRREFVEGPSADLTPLLIGSSGGGIVDAPVVFAGWGISPADFPPQRLSVFSAGDFGTAVSIWEDDLAKVDVRGKVALIFRLPNIRSGRTAKTWFWCRHGRTCPSHTQPRPSLSGSPPSVIKTSPMANALRRASATGTRIVLTSESSTKPACTLATRRYGKACVCCTP